MSSVSKGLTKDEDLLYASTVNKAGAVFPIFDLRKVDLFLLFQNYWKWKRNIYIKFKISLRNSSGKEIYSSPQKKPSNINKISVRELCDKKNIPYKSLNSGTIEIEISSKENIYFPFPAIMCLYVSKKGHTSTVHSAGRNTSKFKKEIFSETNFCIVFNEQFKPFIHLFNGQSGILDNLRVEIVSANNKISSSIEPLIKPYESKIIFLEDIFDIYSEGCQYFLKEKGSSNKKLKLDDDYCIFIRGRCENIFPRFIVGNFDVINNYPCVTHSFREIVEEDYFSNINNNLSASTIALPIPSEDIKLKLKIFPTISPNKTNIDIHIHNLKDLREIKSYTNINLSTNKGKVIFENISKENSPGYGLVAKVNNPNEKLPTRIPVNLLFSLNENSASLPTDIALQFRTKATRFKKNFWYNNIFSDDYLNVVFGSSFMGRSFNKKNNDRLIFKFLFNIENDKETYEKIFKFEEEDSRSFLLNINSIFEEMITRKIDFKQNNFISYAWRIQIIEGEIQDVYCLTYNKKIGCISGDHSF